MKNWIAVIALLSSALFAQDGRLKNGVYAIEEGNRTEKPLVTRQHEGKALQLDTTNYVPLTLAGKPVVNQGPQGSSLTVQLAPDATRRLEGLTRSHLNRTIAIVIGDRVLSAPAVRSIITDGKAMLTPCEDDSCTALLRELTR